jgi:hypothetical protein
VANAQQRSITITESNITHIVQDIRSGRVVYHAVKLVERPGCTVTKVIDESSPASIAESLALVFFDPCCDYLSVIVSDPSVLPHES